MSKTLLDTAFASGLVRLSHLVDRAFSESSREWGLTPQQAQLLCVVIDRPAGVTELGRQLNLEKSSVTGLVDRVERRGLVVRTPDPRDRRASRVTPTDEGERLGVEVHNGVVRRLEKLGEGMPQAERELVTAALTRLTGGVC